MSRAVKDVEGDEDGSGDAAKSPKLAVAGGVQAQLTKEQWERVVSVLKLVEGEVRILAPRAKAWEHDDLVARGKLGAMHASLRFNRAMGTAFSTYAVPWIRGEIWAALREEKRQSALERASWRASRDYIAEESDQFEVLWDSDEMNAARLDTLAARAVAARVFGMGSEPLTPEDALVERESHANAVRVILAALAVATQEEQAVVSLRFAQQRELNDIAKELGVNEKTVRRHLEKVLDKLCTALVTEGITEAKELRDRAYAWGDWRKTEGIR